jgi:hemerythrin-like metal-binding protein
VRQIDTVARFGGDEFVVMLAQLPEDAVESVALARSIAEKIRTTLAVPYRLTIRTQDGAEVYVDHCCSASIGVAMFGGQDLYQEEIVKRADKAMYEAKELGRNSVEFAPQSLQQAGLVEQRHTHLVQMNWRSAYRSGNAVIDDQHRGLFDDANRLLTAILTGSVKEEVVSLIDALIRDVIVHFDEEVRIITAAGFGGAAAHAVIHGELVERARTLASRFEEGTLGVGELFQFLAHDVVARHMLKEDREFFACLQASPGPSSPL